MGKGKPKKNKEIIDSCFLSLQSLKSFGKYLNEKKKKFGCNCKNSKINYNNCFLITILIEKIDKITKNATKSIKKNYLKKVKNSKKIIKKDLLIKEEKKRIRAIKKCNCCKNKDNNSIKSLKLIKIDPIPIIETSIISEDFETIDFMTNYEFFIKSQSSKNLIIKKNKSKKKFNSSVAKTTSFIKENQKEKKDEKIISRDISRTFQYFLYFKNKKTKFDLKQLLLYISDYSKNTNYVQGMNFWAAGIIYHSRNIIFNKKLVGFIFTYLEMEKVYCFKSIDCFMDLMYFLIKKHCEKILFLMKDENFDLKLFLLDWFFCLGFNKVPIEYSKDLLKGIIFHGWYFFFKLIISYLKNFQDFFKKELNSDLNENKVFRLQLALKTYNKDFSLDWNKIFKKLKNFSINKKSFNQSLDWKYGDYFTSPSSFF